MTTVMRPADGTEQLRTPRARKRPPADLRAVIASGGARALLLPVSAVLSLATSHVLVRSVGSVTFGAVVFVGTLFQLLPFADLGVGAAVTRAIASSDDPRADPQVRALVRRSLRILVGSGTVVAGAAVFVGAFGWWDDVLGLHGQLPHLNLITTACLVVFAAGLPFALGQRVLLGLGKNHIAIGLGVVTSVTTLALALGLRIGHASAAWYVLIYPAALVTGSVVTTAVAARTSGLRLSVAHALRSPAIAGAPQARVLHIALPMFLLSVGLPIGLQSDELVISHRLPPPDLSEYALASQLFLPCWAVLSAGAYALLPIFTRRRARGVPWRRAWFGVSAAFAGISLVVGLIYVLAAPFVAHLVSSGRVRIGLDLRIAFAALLVVQIASLVSGMVLNRPDELRFQAGCVLTMMVANLGLSWWLAAQVGVAGPVVASAATVGALMLVPLWLRGLRTSE